MPLNCAACLAWRSYEVNYTNSITGNKTLVNLIHICISQIRLYLLLTSQHSSGKSSANGFNWASSWASERPCHNRVIRRKCMYTETCSLWNSDPTLSCFQVRSGYSEFHSIYYIPRPWVSTQPSLIPHSNFRLLCYVLLCLPSRRQSSHFPGVHIRPL